MIEIQLYRAKRRARNENEGKHVKAFTKLRKWYILVLEHNPNSVVKMEFYHGLDTNACQPQFKRIFVCFNVCSKGFLRDLNPLLELMIVSSRVHMGDCV